MTTNEFERDFNDQAGLKRPGRIDFRTLQNTADAGDGSPGVQRCFRNYLHEGGMEKDIDLLGYGIKGTSVDISNVKLQQLSNIGSVEINGTRWGYVGEADQPVKQADSPTFLKLIVTQITGTAPFTISSTTKVTNLNADQCDSQHLGSTDSPTFNGLSINGNIVITGNVDGVDVSAHAANNSAHHAAFTAANARAAISNVIGSDGHLDANLDADQHKIVDLATPISDNDAAIRSSAGQGNPSTTVQQSNNAEKMTGSETYVKLKEIIVYRNLKDFTVKWEMKADPPNGVYCKVYINGIAVGIEKNTTSASYVVMTDDISNIYTGDLLQIYGRTWDEFTDLYVQNMEIRYDFFANNDP